MSNSTLVMFIAVEAKNLVLPIAAWNNEIGDLLQRAYDNHTSELCMAIGRGYEFYDILNIRDRCNFKDLSFLDSECSTLQGLELTAVIRSLTIAIDELSNKFDNLNYSDFFACRFHYE